MIRRLRHSAALASWMACLMTAWAVRPAFAVEETAQAQPQQEAEPAAAEPPPPATSAAATVAARAPAFAANGAAVPFAVVAGGDRSAVSAQAISLPQGGGTVGGMGESFSAQLSTGIATGRIDIALPAARGAAQPALALTYSSGSGHEVAGVGWQLAVPSVSRQTDRGVPGYADPAAGGDWTATQDRFVAGTDELVPICLVQPGGGCARALPGETMPSWASGWQYFRTRNERGFARWFWSPDHRTWRVQHPSGVTEELGVPLDGSGDTGALEVDPANGARVFRWSLARQYDSAGDATSAAPRPSNVVVYKYLSAGGVSYLQDVYDTPPRQDASASPDHHAHHVHLAYELRPDPTTSYRRGWAVASDRRLSRIDVTSKTFSADGPREQLRRYWLGYDSSSHVSLLTSVQLEGRCSADNPTEDANQQLPSSTSCPRLPATTMGYTHADAVTAAGTPAAADLPGYEPFDTRVRAFDGSPPLSLDGVAADLYDVDADGLPDVLATTTAAGFGANDGAWLQSGSGDGFVAQPVAVIPGLDGDSFQNITFGNGTVSIHDLDGDGVVDMVHMPAAQKYAVYTPTHAASGWVLQGRAVTTASGQSVKLDFTRNNPDIAAMDVNGDGLVDLVYSTSTSYQTFFALGRYPAGADQYGHATWTGPASATVSNDPVAMCAPASSVGIRLSDHDVRVADINGDGLPDLVRLRPGDVKYWPGRGNGLWGTGKLDDCRAGTYGLNRQINMASAPAFTQDVSALRLEDVNGDGLADLVQIRGDAIDVWLNVDGNGWTPGRHTVTSTIGAGLNAHVRLADVNGSGTRDILWGDGGNYRYVDLAGGQRPWLLAHIANGLGKTTDFAYTSVAALMKAARAGTPWQSHMPLPMQVVTSIVESDNLSIAGRAAATYRTEYEYRDPVYDGRQREFRGFATVRQIAVGDDNSPSGVTETRFLLGQCEDEPGGTPSCDAADLWRDNPRESLKGLPLWTESYDLAGNYRSSTHSTYRLRRLYVGSDGREVRSAFAGATDEYRYDDGPFTADGTSVTLTDVELELGSGSVDTSDASAHTLRGSGAAHLHRSTRVDAFGNVTDDLDAGCVDGCAERDEVITHHTTPGRPDGDSGGWLWRVVERHVEGSSTAGTLHRELIDYDAAGRQLRVTRELRGSVALDRFHQDATQAVAPTPATASGDGLIVVKTFGYDELGNLTTESGAHGRCRTVAYDDPYAELPIVETDLVGGSGDGGCGTTPLSTIAGYDRGLGLVTMVVDTHGELTTAAYDGFGRVVTLSKPNPSVLGTVSAVPAMKNEYILPSDATATPFTIIHSQLQDGADGDTAAYTEAWAYLDGLGRTVVTLQAADPTAGDGGSFVVRGLTDYDARGAVRRAFEPWFWSGDARAFPLTSAPTTRFRATQYDAFGRALKSYALDGAQDVAHVYHALSVDHFDEADLEPGPHQGTPSTERQDGHGRLVSTVERVHAGGQLETHETRTRYLPSGEKAMITRVRLGSGDAPVVRWIRYDSLGRMVLNVEPDTSRGFSADPTADAGSLKAWRYAWDDDGDLVGTSDARGCGENYWYDAAGRPVAEDYSPCAVGQPAYSAPDLTSGDGTEVFNRWDSPDADALGIGGFGVDGALCAGRLVERSDRAGKVVRRFDGRGRLIGLARRVAKPGVPSPTLADRYAAHWFTQATAFDGADREILTSTGADVPELLGSDGQSNVSLDYSARGAVRSVGGSYGPLVASVVHAADNLGTQVVYGDLAATTTDSTYDDRRRLSTVVTHRGPPAAWSASPPAYRPTPIGAETLQAVLQDARIRYDAVGNPIAIEDLRDPSAWPDGAKPSSHTMQYDDLYRLTEIDTQYPSATDAWTSPFAAEDVGYLDAQRALPAPHQSFDARTTQQTFAYDWLGNVASSDDDAHGFYDRSLGQITNGPATPYQLTAASDETAGGTHVGHLQTRYDDAGELVELIVARAGRCAPVGTVCTQHYAYDWDEVGRLARARRWDTSTPDSLGALPASAAAAELRFAYDGDDQRVVKAAFDAVGHELDTVYVFPSLELRHTTFDGTDYRRDALTEVAYLFARHVRLARVVYGQVDLPSVSGGRQHVLLELADELGSTSIVIDQATSELVERTTNQPFGAVESDYRPARWDAFREDYRFTGKEEDVELGLDYFGKRYYAPSLGRWLSPDPLAVHALGADPNLYAYVHGRVFIAIDVDGLDEELAARADRFAILPIAGPTFSAQNHLDNFVGGIQHRLDGNYTQSASTSVGHIAKEGGLAVLNTGLAVLDLLSLAKAAVQSAGRAILNAEGRNIGRNVIEQAERESGAVRTETEGAAKQYSSNAARREAMFRAKIPRSQQPTAQSRNASGRSYEYEVPAPGGGRMTKSVQQQTLDRSHPGQGHWEAGAVRTDDYGAPAMNRYGRPRLMNGKAKVDYK